MTKDLTAIQKAPYTWTKIVEWRKNQTANANIHIGMCLLIPSPHSQSPNLLKQMIIFILWSLLYILAFPFLFITPNRLWSGKKTCPHFRKRVGEWVDLANNNETKRKNSLNRGLVLFWWQRWNIVTAETIASVPAIFVIAAGKVQEMHDKLYNPQFITGKAHLIKWSLYCITLQVRPYTHHQSGFIMIITAE